MARFGRIDTRKEQNFHASIAQIFQEIYIGYLSIIR